MERGEREAEPPGLGKPSPFQMVPLDLRIRHEFDAQPFEVLLVAFDAHPKNQKLGPTPSSPCRHEELSFVLDRFSESSHLPARFRDAAVTLRARRRSVPIPARGGGRAIRGPLDLLYMDPEFEALLVSDDNAVRRVFSFDSRPKDWPRLPPAAANRPKVVLSRLIDRHRDRGPPHCRTTFNSNPHAWALEIVRAARRSHRFWRHPITARLRLILG